MMFCVLLLASVPALAQQDPAQQESAPTQPDYPYSATTSSSTNTCTGSADCPDAPTPNVYVPPAKPKFIGPQPKKQCDIDIYTDQPVAKDQVFGGAYMKLSEAGIEYQCPVHWRLGRLAHATVYRGVGVGLVGVHQGNLAEEGFWGDKSLPLTDLAKGAEITPISVELRWRDGKAVEPFAQTKLNLLATNNLFSNDANRFNLGFTAETGVLIKLKGKYYLRAAIGEEHASDAYLTKKDPESTKPNAPLGHSDPGGDDQFASLGFQIFFGGAKSDDTELPNQQPKEGNLFVRAARGVGHAIWPQKPSQW